MKLHRIRLTFNRNLDSQTTRYRIYRADHTDVQRTDVMIMEVAQIREINPIEVINEKLTMITQSIYAFKYEQIYMDESHPVIIYFDGRDAMYETGYMIDFELGQIQFDEPTNKLVTADYYFDGIEVLDDDRDQAGVKYIGPIAKDYSIPDPPWDVALTVEDSIVLTYKPGALFGRNYYYKAVALDDVGHFSNLSTEASVYIMTGLPKYPYIIESSKDHGTSWIMSGRTSELKYTEYGLDRVPPDNIANFNSVVELKHNLSTANVKLTWDQVTDSHPGVESPMYRVRMATESGAISLPSVMVGPVFVKTEIDKIVVRRRFYDGSIPSFDGTDSETIIVLNSLSTTYTDIVTDNSEYIYSIFAVDRAGNISTGTTLRVDVGDATAPYTPDIILSPVDLIF